MARSSTQVPAHETPAERSTRRSVLRGAGGFTLALPFLPSLAPRTAEAQAQARAPRFIAVTTEHGGIARENMFPPSARLTRSSSLVTGHDIWHAPLSAERVGNNTVVSPVLSAPATVFPAALAAKMNVLQGIDIPFYINHHSGGHLGNFARNNGTINTSAEHFVPTVDQVMGWSNSFYRDLSGVRERVVVTGDRDGISWNYANPAARSGAVQRIDYTREARALFDRLFSGFSAPMPGPMRPRLIDRVLESYRQLRTGNRRLSASDRTRLDAHIAQLDELDRKLGVGGPSQACTTTASDRPATLWSPDHDAPEADGRRYFQVINDIVVAAMACGLTRVAVIAVANHFYQTGASWHQDYAHKHKEAGPQGVLVEALRRTFQHVFLDLASKLDALDDGAGGRLLDQTLIMWSQESGFDTHDSMSIPIITAGSAGGYFNTGHHVDFRRRVPAARLDFGWAPDPQNFAGVPYARWLGTVLQSMGLAPGEWETPGYGGYGKPFGYGLNAEGVDRYVNKYLPAVLQSLSTPLPIIT